MQAHRLRHRVTFQRYYDVEKDGDGYAIPGTGGYQTVVLPSGLKLENVPAEVLTGPGREWIASGAKQSEVSGRINLRWFPSTEKELAAWRVLWDGRIYNITSATTDATSRREWRLLVVDGPTEGS